MTKDSPTEQSFGIIPVHQSDDGLRCLLIRHLAGHWGFPKGHAEPGETDFEAACREFEEETGVSNYDAAPDTSFAEHYVCVKKGRKISKTVRYFPATVQNQDLTLQTAEIQDARWLPLEQACELLTFEASRTMLSEAMPVILAFARPSAD